MNTHAKHFLMATNQHLLEHNGNGQLVRAQRSGMRLGRKNMRKLGERNKEINDLTDDETNENHCRVPLHSPKASQGDMKVRNRF